MLPLPSSARLDGSAFQPSGGGLVGTQAPRKGEAFPHSRRQSRFGLLPFGSFDATLPQQPPGLYFSRGAYMRLPMTLAGLEPEVSIRTASLRSRLGATAGGRHSLCPPFHRSNLLRMKHHLLSTAFSCPLSHRQKMYLSANWIWRSVPKPSKVEMVLVLWPNPTGEYALLPGLLNWGVLATLNSSARNSMF